MESISSLKVAERFGKDHKEICKQIRVMTRDDSVIEPYFIPCEYKASRGRSYKKYTITLEGFCLLTDTPAFSRGKGAHIKSSIMRDFGERFAVVGSARNRGEDDFYSMLSRFLTSKVLREYKASKYLLDFYVPDHCLIIEYDEKHHKTESRRLPDKEREEGVLAVFSNLGMVGAKIIRVESGREIEGLAEISKFIQGKINE